MCGRMNLSDHEGVQWLLQRLGLDAVPSQPPRFNVAPTQTLDVVSLADEPALTQMSWGVSMQTKGKKGQAITRRVSNSRSDKVWTSYLWRYLIPEQRALIPVNGFYEWKRENKKLVQAYHITPNDAPAMFFAAIYRLPKEANTLPEVSIVTTEANPAMAAVHDRMPVILTSQNAAMAWISENDRDTLDALMAPASNDALQFTPVSNYVNKSSNEGDQCIVPA